MVVLWKYTMQRVRCEMQSGVLLELRVGTRMLFFQLKCFICDEVALKQPLETKGATGTTYNLRPLLSERAGQPLLLQQPASWPGPVGMQLPPS